MATPVLQFKRGAFTALPALKAGEPGFTTDKHDFFIGLDNNSANNKFFGSHRYWFREDGTSSAEVRLVDKDGSNFISLSSPNTLAGITSYTLPGTNGSSGSVLVENGSGGLSWSSTGFTFTNTTLTGITTINGTSLDVNVPSDFSGITTFSNTTDSTDKDTGAVVVEGGVGIEKNLSVGGATTITGNLFVGGTSEFIGVVTFRGGTINIGDSDTDDVVIGGEFASSLIPTTDGAHDIGEGGSPKRWRNANFSGIGTFATGAVVDALQIGISGSSEIDTSSGVLTLDSAVGQVVVDDHLSVTGLSTFTGEADFNGGATIDNIRIGIAGDNEIDTSTGNLTIDSAGGLTTIDDNLTVSGITTVSGNFFVSGLTDTRVLFAGPSGQITDSGDLTFASNILTVVNTVDVTNLEVSNIKAKDGTSSITIADGTGVVGISTNLTVNGNLIVTGDRTEVNTETLLVEDQLIEVGLINSGGNLVPPSTTTSHDLGVLFHYFSGSAKKAALFWDNSASRIAVASSITENAGPEIANISYAGFEIGSLWVNDCQGQSQVISCTGSERFLENITIDAGSF